MKSPYVDTLAPNEVVTAYFLVLSKEIRQKKTGEPYLWLQLADRTGEIEARMWDNVAEVMHTFERDHFVKVKGLAQLYNNRSQFTVHKLRRLEDGEVDFSDFFPCSERDRAEMVGELERIVDGIANPHLRGLLQRIFADRKLAELYAVAPAAKSIHHACRGGLLEHVLSLCALARLTAAHYPEVDLDLLLAGVILHDIGKVEELTYQRSFGYSAEGQLLGHIILGLRLLAAHLDALPDFPPRLRTLLEHLVLSHHGKLEFGSPKLPMFAEAMLLHHLDNLDSKMNAIRSALRRDRASDGEFTGWVGSLERVLLRKERYLDGAPAAAAAPPPPPPAPEVPEAETPVSESAAVPVTPEPDRKEAAAAVPAQAEIPGLEKEPPKAPAPAVSPDPPKPRPMPAPPLERRPEPLPHRPQVNTVLADKLQAVLEGRK